MTISEALVLAGIAYLIVGMFWVMRNHNSTMARMDREQWRREGKLWKLVLVPVVVALVWPLAFVLWWKIKRAVASGEFDRIKNQVVREWTEQGKIKCGHIVGPDSPHESKHRRGGTMEIRIKVGPKRITARSNPHGKVFCCGIFRDGAKEQDILEVLAWTKKTMVEATKAKKKRA